MRVLLLTLAAVLGIAAMVARIATGPLFAEEGGPRAAWTDDFLQDYVSARAWRDGDDPYGKTIELRDRYVADVINDGTPPGQVNPHPPIAFVIAAPVSLLPYDIARTIWLILSAVFIASSVGVVARYLGASTLAASAIGLGSLAVPVVQKDLSFGQNNGLLLALLVGGWLAMRHGRSFLGGALLGIAIATKLFPLFLLIPLLRSDARRTAGIALLSAGLVSGLAVLLVGWDAHMAFAFEASPTNFGYWRAGPMNLSLVALPFRWLTDSPWRQTAVDVPALAFVLSLLAILACVVAAWRTPAHATGERFWAAVPWMILATPLAWEHYLVIALPVVAFSLTRAFRIEEIPLALVTAAAAAMMIGTPPGVSTTVPGISDLTQVLAYGLPMYGLLAVGLFDLRGKELPAHDHARPPAPTDTVR